MVDLLRSKDNESQMCRLFRRHATQPFSPASICDGCDTIPISNGFDNYGQHIRLFNEENKVDLLIGYLHKIIAPVGAETQAADMVHVCEVYQIPFLVIVPKELHALRSTASQTLAGNGATRRSCRVTGEGT